MAPYGADIGEACSEFVDEGEVFMEGIMDAGSLVDPEVIAIVVKPVGLQEVSSNVARIRGETTATSTPPVKTSHPSTSESCATSCVYSSPFPPPRYRHKDLQPKPRCQTYFLFLPSTRRPQLPFSFPLHPRSIRLGPLRRPPRTWIRSDRN